MPTASRPSLLDEPSRAACARSSTSAVARGFPASPLRSPCRARGSIWSRPSRRKCEFRIAAAASAGPRRTRVPCRRGPRTGRAGEGRGRYGVALVRAVASLRRSSSTRRPLLRQGGRAARVEGSTGSGRGARRRAAEAARDAAGRSMPLDVRPVTPDTRAGRNRHLHLYQKVRPARRHSRAGPGMRARSGRSGETVRPRARAVSASGPATSSRRSMVRPRTRMYENPAPRPRFRLRPGLSSPLRLWRLSMRWQTRRAAWGRPRPPSTWPPASPRPVTRTLLVDLDPQCNATVALGMPKDLEPNTYTCLLGRRRDRRRRAADRDRPPVRRLPSTPDLAGATVELPRLDSSEQRLREALAPVRSAVRPDRPRLPALARAAVGQRAGRRRPRARPRAGRVPGARGPRPVPRHARADPARAEPAPRGGGDAAHHVRQPHAARAGRRARAARATSPASCCGP